MSRAAGRFELRAEIPLPGSLLTAVTPDPRPAGAPAPRESMTRSPRATARTAPMSSPAGSSLSRKPRTPARRAAPRLAGASRPVRISTRQLGSRLASSAAAVSPSTPGRPMSSSATSGWCSRAAGTIWSPAATAAVTSMSVSSPSSATSVSRTTRASSAIRTRITGDSPSPCPACWACRAGDTGICGPPIYSSLGHQPVARNLRAARHRRAERTAPPCSLHVRDVPPAAATASRPQRRCAPRLPGCGRRAW